MEASSSDTQRRRLEAVFWHQGVHCWERLKQAVKWRDTDTAVHTIGMHSVHCTLLTGSDRITSACTDMVSIGHRAAAAVQAIHSLCLTADSARQWRPCKGDWSTSLIGWVTLLPIGRTRTRQLVNWTDCTGLRVLDRRGHKGMHG